jgi:hypothetical protein
MPINARTNNESQSIREADLPEVQSHQAQERRARSLQQSKT